MPSFGIESGVVSIPDASQQKKPHPHPACHSGVECSRTIFWFSGVFLRGMPAQKTPSFASPAHARFAKVFSFAGDVPGCWYYPTQSGMQKVSFGGGALIFPPGHPALALALFYQIWPCPCKCPNGHKNGICVCFYPKSAISCRDCPINPPKSLCTPPTKSYKFVSANPCETDAGRINKYDCSGCVGGSFWNFIRFRDFPEALQNLSVIFAHARCHLPCQERLWHSVAFSSKTKSVSSKTKPLCQGLPCQGSWRADARLRGWTKDAFRLSGITQVLLCTTSPSSSLTLDATSPSRGGFGIPSRFPTSPNQFHRKRNLFAKGSPARRAVERMRD